MRPSHWITLALASLPLMAGCASLVGNGPQSPSDGAGIPDGGDRVARHLEALAVLASRPPPEQAALAEAARIDFVAVPTPGNRLRYALFLGMPGHAGFDPSTAHELLATLLDAPEGLSAPEQDLAAAINHELEALLSIQARLRDHESAAAHARDQLAAVHQRNQSLTAENQRLTEQLDESRRKLEAIAELEKALSTRRVEPERRP